VGYVYILFSPVDQPFRQKQEQRNAELDILNQVNLTDIFRTFHLNTKKYTFFETAHRTFSKIDHILKKVSVDITKENFK
jgi:exonuclease III